MTVALVMGQIAALLAAAAFSITSICYTFAGRKVNSVTAIAMSLPTSWVMLAGLHGASLGELFPTGAGMERWFYLGTSGILAYVISSYFMLNAYQAIGPRLTMLIASFAPILGALFAWLFVGQTLPPNATLGIGLVTFGIVWVVMERNPRVPASPARITHDIRRGALQATLGTVAQAAAFVFSSQGVADGFPPLSGALMRITAGTVALWLFLAWQGKLRTTANVFRHNRPLFFQLTGAALSGPVIAGWLLLLAFQTIPVGVATTLSHTTSIMLIPAGYFVFKEHISLRAVLGTIVAIVGIGILFI